MSALFFILSSYNALLVKIVQFPKCLHLGDIGISTFHGNLSTLPLISSDHFQSYRLKITVVLSPSSGNTMMTRLLNQKGKRGGRGGRGLSHLFDKTGLALTVLRKKYSCITCERTVGYNEIIFTRLNDTH